MPRSLPSRAGEQGPMDVRRHRRQSAQADFSAIPPVRGMAGFTRQRWEIWTGRPRAQPGGARRSALAAPANPFR